MPVCQLPLPAASPVAVADPLVVIVLQLDAWHLHTASSDEQVSSVATQRETRTRHHRHSSWAIVSASIRRVVPLSAPSSSSVRLVHDLIPCSAASQHAWSAHAESISIPACSAGYARYALLSISLLNFDSAAEVNPSSISIMATLSSPDARRASISTWSFCSRSRVA